MQSRKRLQQTEKKASTVSTLQRTKRANRRLLTSRLGTIAADQLPGHAVKKKAKYNVVIYHWENTKTLQPTCSVCPGVDSLGDELWRDSGSEK